jgi:hypothetical protein
VRAAGKDIGRGRKLAGASGGQLIREDAESITGIPHQLGTDCAGVSISSPITSACCACAGVCIVRFDAAAGSLRFKIAASTFLDRKIIQETRLRG